MELGLQFDDDDIVSTLSSRTMPMSPEEYVPKQEPECWFLAVESSAVTYRDSAFHRANYLCTRGLYVEAAEQYEALLPVYSDNAAVMRELLDAAVRCLVLLGSAAPDGRSCALLQQARTLVRSRQHLLCWTQLALLVDPTSVMLAQSLVHLDEQSPLHWRQLAEAYSCRQSPDVADGDSALWRCWSLLYCVICWEIVLHGAGPLWAASCARQHLELAQKELDSLGDIGQQVRSRARQLITTPQLTSSECDTDGEFLDRGSSKYSESTTDCRAHLAVPTAEQFENRWFSCLT